MGRTTGVLAVALLLLGASPFRSVDRETARRLVRVAREARDEEQLAAVRTILTRALELDPENRDARKGLLFVKEKGGEGWTRDPDDQATVEKWRDTDEKKAREYLLAARDVDRWRSRRIVGLSEKKLDEKKRREILLDLLARTPREPMVHRALGHEKIGEVYVRPGLLRAFRARGPLEVKWAKLRDEEFEVRKAEHPFAVPGVPNELPTVLCEGQEFVSTFSEAETRELAIETQRVYALVRVLLGPRVEVWTPYRIVVLDSIGYRRMIYELHDDPEEQKAKLRFGTYGHPDFFALQSQTLARARDDLAHAIGFYSMQLLAAPGEEEKRDAEAYAFLREGFGYLLSLELFDTALMFFHSDTESSQKVRFTTPSPKERRGGAILTWLQDLGRQGELLPLPQVFGRSLNNLDFRASMEAASFLRFLAIYDPIGFRNFPLFLREKEKGSYAARVAEALEDAFEVPAAELETLWRAWLLEVL